VLCGLKLFPASASSATVLPLPVHTPCSDNHRSDRTAGAKSSLYTGSDSFPPSRQTTYQTDSFPRDETDSVSNHGVSNCSQLDASAVSSCDSYGRDAFMNCDPVWHALDMGFDWETVRHVVHLRVIQSGRTCALVVISDRK